MTICRGSACQWTPCALFATALALAWAPATTFANDRYAAVVVGQWRLMAALDGADIASLDEHEARELIGRVFVIDKRTVKFGSRNCGPSDFDATSVEPSMFLRGQFHADAGKLGLPNPVTVVDLSCTSVFVKSKDRLVIAWKGWFFDAVRITPLPLAGPKMH